jgi:Peptidase family M28
MEPLLSRFDPQSAITHAKNLARPRLVGTLGEIEARQYLLSKLGAMGYRPEEKPFNFYPTYHFDFLRGSILAVVCALLLHRMLIFHFPATIAIAGLLIPVAAAQLWKRWQSMERSQTSVPGFESELKIPNKKRAMEMVMRSSNIEAVLSKPENPKATVYLTAHYDTKSQNYSIVFRIAFAGIFGTGLFATPVAYFLAWLFPEIYGSVLFFGGVNLLFVGSMIGGLSLALMNVDNESPGALDNAGSCGLILGLAEGWQTIVNGPAFENIEVRAVLTGAEEVGLAGADAMVIQHRGEWDKEKTFFLNFDGIGASRRHSATSETAMFTRRYLETAPLIDMFSDSAKELGLPFIRVTGGIFGGEADHIPMVKAGFKAVTIGSVDRNSFRIHTAGDTPDLLSLKAMTASGELAEKVLGKLDQYVR